jgi:hypothetical protein
MIVAVALDDSTVDGWFEALLAAQAELAADAELGLDGFRSVLTARAEQDGMSTVAEEFLEYLDQESGIDEELLRKTAELEDTLPDVYRALRPFAWLTDDSWDEFESLWASEWPATLDGQLRYRWGEDWQDQSDTDKRTWMVDLQPELILPTDVAEPEEPDESTVDSEEEPAPTPDTAAADALAIGLAAAQELRTAHPGLDLPDDVLISVVNERMKAWEATTS